MTTYRKYTVRVSPRINCSSSFDYHAVVKVKDSKAGITRRNYHIGSNTIFANTARLQAYRGYPAYVHTAIREQLRAMYAAGELVVYEYDRDGNQRTDNLRYHDYERLASVIGGKG
jgi:hypothetical protein